MAPITSGKHNNDNQDKKTDPNATAPAPATPAPAATATEDEAEEEEGGGGDDVEKNSGVSGDDGEEGRRRRRRRDGARGPAPMGLCRQLCVSAGLMSSDGGLVFLQLAMMPCLQTLGVPVSLVTVAGVLSGSLALMGLPVMGWVSDGGTNPHRRKKPAVVVSALVFVAGYSLVIAGCALRLRMVHHQPHPPRTNLSTSTTTTTTTSTTSTTGPGSNNLGPLSPGFSLEYNNLTLANLKVLTLDSAPLSPPPPSEDNSSNSNNTVNNDHHHSDSPVPSGTLEGSLPDPGNGSDVAPKTSPPADSEGTEDDPLGLGIPLTGLLGILGFVFMDMGNDLNNSCVKGLVLSCTARSQHSSLFVVGVLMSAVGGCLAAVLGVLDIAAFIVRGEALDAVPAKTLLQASFFLVLTVVCNLVTLCSAPAILPNTSGRAGTSPTPSPLPSPPPSVLSLSDPKDREKEEPRKTPLSPEENEEEDGHAEDSSPRLSSSHRCSLTSDRNSSSSRSSRSSSLIVVESLHAAAGAVVGDSSPLQGCPDTANCTQEKRLVQKEYEKAEFLKCGNFSIRRTTLRMVPVCVSMFFMAGAWQSFNICATDYLGKVVYDGDPDADRVSPAYHAYRQGIRSGSLGVLMLNVAYVAVNMLQKKILALTGPKAEYLAVCVVQVAVLLSVQLTDRVEVFYTAAVVYGLFRSVMYTVPFMLANAICQQAVRPYGASRQARVARVGSTMALMTAMMPLSYVLVSTVTGPLIHATGDPAAPLYYATVCTALAAFVFAFT